MRIHRFFLFSLAVLLSLGVMTEGCKRDKCKKVVCVNGECVDGDCICQAGYGGSDCSAPLNANYAGTFSLTEQCTAGADAYDLFLEPVSGSLDQVRVAGLWGKPQDSVIVTVAKNGTDFSATRTGYAGKELKVNGVMESDGQAGTVEFELFQVGANNPFDVCTATFEVK
ncbi:MAG TPA: hypothetical protein ENJ82_07825 [Bacteroidetes bacterium]|nr:hypothetical protein [Bacteroidota bacterium]